MMTSEVLRALDDRALVRRAADPTDRRIKRVTTTDAGGDLAQLSIALVEQTDREFLGNSPDPPNCSRYYANSTGD